MCTPSVPGAELQRVGVGVAVLLNPYMAQLVVHQSYVLIRQMEERRVPPPQSRLELENDLPEIGHQGRIKLA